MCVSFLWGYCLLVCLCFVVFVLLCVCVASVFVYVFSLACWFVLFVIVFAVGSFGAVVCVFCVCLLFCFFFAFICSFVCVMWLAVVLLLFYV